MKTCILICALITSIIVSGQNTLLIGTKSYSATASWGFKVNDPNASLGSNLVVAIAKDGEQGLLYLSKHTDSPNETLLGPCLIYLEDNTVISCITVISRDYVDNNSTLVFRLIHSEIVKMANSRIRTIRYNIQGVTGKTAYTADNKIEHFHNPYWDITGKTPPKDSEEQKTYHETDVEIKSLFNL